MLDVTAPELDGAIAAHDIVISLVPFTYHAGIIRSAIKSKTQVVTTSYVSAAIRELDTAAREAGITIVNEVGVDPGIDHLYAVKIIGDVHERGGKVSACLPYFSGLLRLCMAYSTPLRSRNSTRTAADCRLQRRRTTRSDSRLAHLFLAAHRLEKLRRSRHPYPQFSWSPRGALLSQYNSATFLQNGEVVEISNKDLMAKAIPHYVMDGYSFVAYPNRDSLPFREFYQIPEAHTAIRGSLRYSGNPSMVKALIDLGWLDSEPKDWLTSSITWAQIQQKATGAASAAEADLIAKVDELCHLSGSAERDTIVSGLRWIGLFSDEPATTYGNLLDTLSARLYQLCKFQPGERDLVMLQHKFVVEWKDGTTVSEPDLIYTSHVRLAVRS